MTGRYVLYGFRLTGSCAIEAALAEAGVAHDFVAVNTKAGETRTEAFRKINPRQQVPVLVLPDGTTVTEGPAILVHIADAHPATRLIPPPGSNKRTRHDRWLAFFHANIYEGELRQLFPQRYVDDPAAAESAKRAADSYVERHFRIFEEEVKGSPYFFGEELTVLDIYVWMLTQWMPMEWMRAHCPRVASLSEAVARRPLIAPVHARHFG
ncbi:MAG: glutathione S-transferase family protein [Alphaproteobacteria bacterium]|nr:glutathione S-transferase family protein [Alphaproteobacteria bacterium]